MNNVLAVGGRAATLTANSSTPVPHVPTTPPSPTAVAINLLNVLKIANTMSHPLYNPYVPGKQSSSQGQYGHSSGPAERDPRKATPHLGPGSGFSSPAASSVALGNTGDKIPSLLTLPTTYRPERSRATVDADIERSVDLHISRAREEVRHQPVGQGTRFAGSQREEFPSSSTGMTPYLTSSASQGHRHSDVEGNASLDWLPIYKKSSEDHSSKMYPSASSGYVSSGDGRFKASSEGQRDMLSIPGLGDFDDPMQDKSAPPKESGRPKYTSESASNILLHFGLEKEDLEHLISYPEDQITPDNLPFILRQIRIQKAKRVATAGHSVPYSKPQTTTSVSEMDRLSTTMVTGMNPDEMSSAILKPSQVIDYGHTGKYTAGVGNEMGRTIGSTANSGGSSGILMMNTFSSSGHSRETLQRSTKEMKSGTSIPSHDQMSSVTSFGSMRSPMVPPSSDPAKRMQTQINQTSQPSIFTNFSILKKDTDKSLPLKPPQPDHQLTSNTQPPCTLFRGVHPGRPGLVLIGSNDGSCSNTKTKSQGQAPNVAEQIQKQQTQQQMKKPPPTQQSRQQQVQQVQHHLKQPLQLRNLPPAKLVPLPPVIPGIAGVPPAPPQPISSQKDYSPRTPLTSSNKEVPTNVTISKHMPTPAMLEDYAAASPRVFPHVCLLCNWECTNMKDWVTHQNSGLHLENCRCLRTRYPEWDGEIRPLQSAPGKDVKPPPSASAQTPQIRHQTTRHKSASLLQGPHGQRGSEDRREKRSSRSRSRSPRYHCGSEGRREKRSSRSRSRSPRHGYASEGRRERRSSRSWSPHTSRHTRRSRPRSLSPGYDPTASSHHRSRSKSHERQPSPRRRDEKRSSLPRSRERRSPPRRGDDIWQTPPRSHERRPSTERSLPQRRRSNSAERLAKRLLETSAAQSLSKQPNLEAMVKTLAPALLAELAKMKSSTAPSAASSLSSNVAKKAGTAKTVKAKPSFPRPATSSTAKSNLVKSSPPTMVRLKGIFSSLSHNDVISAVGNFGKTKSVVLFRSKQEAVVCFERLEDAEKLRDKAFFNLKGLKITVVREKDAVSKKPQPTSSKEQKKPPQQKSTNSGVSAAQTSKATSTGKSRAPSSSTSATKKNTTGKVETKARVSVSKAKPASTKPTVRADSVAGRGGGKSGEVTKEASELSGAKELKIPQKKQKTGDSKPTTAPESPKGSAKKPEVAPKEKADQPSNGSVCEPLKDKGTRASKAETRQEHKTEAKDSTAAKAVKEKVAEKTEAKVKQEPLGSKVSENQPDAAEKFQPKIVEIKTEGSAPVPGDAGEAVEPEDEKLSDVKQQAESAPADVETEEVKDDKRLERGETGAAEPMEVESSAEAKEPKLADAEALPDKPSDSHPSTSAPPADSPRIQQASAPESEEEKTLPAKVRDSPAPTCTVQTAPSEPSADPPRSSGAVPHPESSSQEPETKTKHQNQLQAAGSSAEAALKEKQNVEGQETKTKQKGNQTDNPATAAKTQQDPLKADSGVSAASPDTPPTEKTEKQHDKSSCVQVETSKSLKPSPSEPSGNGQQPTPQSTASATPATSAGSIFPGAVAAEANKVAKRVEKPGAEVTARPAKATEGGERGREEGSAAASVTPADTLPAASSAPSSGIPDGSGGKEIPHMDADIFRAITTALREHRLTQRSATTSQDKEDTSKSNKGPVIVKDESTPQEEALDVQEEPFDEETFNFEDFVTVDEISEDIEDAAVDDSSSSHKQASGDKKGRQGSDASSSAKKTSKRSSKDSKSSSASASKSSSSSSVSPKKQKDSSESTKSHTRPSSSASVSKTSSSSSSSQSAETSVSSGLKAQPRKGRSHAPSAGRSTRSSAAAVKMSTETSHKVEAKPTVTAVTKSDHQGSAESSAAKNVESEIKIETSSEMDPPAQRREFELTNQTQSLKSDSKDETPKEVKTSKDKGRKKDDDRKQTEEEGDDCDSYRILDSLDDEAEEEKQDGSTETQTSGPEPGQRSHEKDHQVSAEEEGKSCFEQCIKMETDAPNQVQNSSTKDQEATVQGDSDLIKDESSTVKQVSEGVMTSAVNSSDMSSVASLTNQVMDKDTNQIPQTRGEGEVLSQEFCKTTTDDKLISQDKNQSLEDRDNKDTLKAFTEQEAFETVDSVDDQTVAEGDSRKPETPGGQISEGNIEPTEEEEDAYQVIDSVEDQPTATETESEADGRGDGTKKDNVTAERDDRPNRRGSLRTRTCKSEEKEKSPKKPDRTAEKNKTPTKDSTTGKDKQVVEDTEEMVYEVVDSVEDESVQETSTTEKAGRRRSTRGIKDHKTPTTIHKEVPERPAGEEETEFKILDSVEDEAASDEPAVTTRSTRARREKAKKDAENENSHKEKTPTGRRSKPARDSGDRNKEKAAETEAKTPPEENPQTKKSESAVGDAAEEEATYEILDAVEEDAAGEDRPAAPEKPRRGRPKKDVKTARKQPAAVKKEDSSSRRADEEEAEYQILDSVEDEPVDDGAPIDQRKNVSQLSISKDDDKTKGASSLINEEDEEEPVYHIVDSLEDDQVQEELMATQVSSTKREERGEAVLEITTNDEAAAKEEDSITSDSTAVEVSKKEVEEEKSGLQLADDVEKVGADPSAAEGSGTGEEDRAPKTDVKKEDSPATGSRCDDKTQEKKQKLPKRNEMVAAENALVNLDEVSEEEDDYPDDTAEEEELKKKQAAAKERKEGRRSRERGEMKREQRTQSSSSGGVRARKAKERDLEKVEVDTQELVTLDEVGEDEAAEEGVTEGRGWDRELQEGELQELVTLDEIVEEGEEGKEEQRTPESLPVRREGQSADFSKPENQATLAEAGGDEDKKAEEAEKTTMSAKRKHGDDDTEDSENFVTVDEVGKSEEEQEVATARPKGRPKKRSRQTPVRKYTRGNTVSQEDEEKEPAPAASLDSSSAPDKDASALSNDVQLEVRRKEVGDNQTLEGGVEGQRGKEGRNRADVKVTDKRRRELAGPEAKRSRSLSPCVAADFKLPLFNPKSPLGQEFVVPKSGFFCNLCSVFYLTESAAKETHCSSQTHYNNLLKHYQNLQQNTAASTRASQSSVSD
ncbi:uncharacterized protein [Leuresthes tenuis]|uniref:uncharacterized protein isoform X2 n=1 Tax=Leuresthes tenuis TaxID=355514 RepID=UPI003B509E02